MTIRSDRKRRLHTYELRICVDIYAQCRLDTKLIIILLINDFNSSIWYAWNKSLVYWFFSSFALKTVVQPEIISSFLLNIFKPLTLCRAVNYTQCINELRIKSQWRKKLAWNRGRFFLCWVFPNSSWLSLKCFRFYCVSLAVDWAPTHIILLHSIHVNV